MSRRKQKLVDKSRKKRVNVNLSEALIEDTENINRSEALEEAYWSNKDLVIAKDIGDKDEE